MFSAQIGPEVGGSKGWFLNRDCDDANIPTMTECTYGWKYVWNQEWYEDNTITLNCIGNKNLKNYIYQFNQLSYII